MGQKVLMTATTLAASGVELLEEHDCAVDFLETGSARELAEALRTGNYDAVISRTLALPRQLIEAAPSLKIISRHGVGYNNVDLASATERGIPVTIADGANGQSVAELAVGLALAVARKITELDANVRHGGWDRSMTGLQLAGRTAGIVAFGAIGQRVASMLRAMGMTILAYDPHARHRNPQDAIWVDTLGELLARSDLVSLHCPLTPETRNMIAAPQLAGMRRDSIIINTARGGLIDEKALADAISSGQIAGAGLDTFAEEPLPDDHVFRSLPSIIMTPHMGGSTDAALDNVAISAARNVVDFLLKGKIDPRLLVNPDVLKQATIAAK